MQLASKLGIVVLVVIGVITAGILRPPRAPAVAPAPPALAAPAPTTTTSAPAVTVTLPSPVATAASPAATVPATLPRLVDLGAGKCIPCKLMAPILAELRQEYAGRLRVDFIDVWVNPAAAEPYGISVIPTQIFYAADGRELARHEGFLAKADILAQWQALGVSFATPATPLVPPLEPTVLPPPPPCSDPDAPPAPGTRPCCAK